MAKKSPPRRTGLPFQGNLLRTPVKKHGKPQFFRERQRQTTQSSAKKEEKPIEVKPFTEIGEITQINISDYRGISRYIKGLIHPSESLESAVTEFMVNTLLNLPDNFYEPGKKYSGEERVYTRAQLDVFRKSMSGLEIHFRKPHSISIDSIGHFPNKQKENIGTNPFDILKNHLYQKLGNHHIVYIGNPSRIHFPTDEEKRKIAIANALSKYEKQILEIESDFKPYLEKEEIKKLEEEITKDISDDDILTFPQKLGKTCKEYLDSKKTTPLQRGYLTKLIELGDIVAKAVKEAETEAETEKLPDQKEIIRVLSQNAIPSGAVIISSTEIGDIPGLELIRNYDTVSLYQRINPS